MVFLLLRMDSVLIYTFLKQGAGCVYAMPSASISISPENSSFSCSFEVIWPFSLCRNLFPCKSKWRAVLPSWDTLPRQQGANAHLQKLASYWPEVGIKALPLLLFLLMYFLGLTFSTFTQRNNVGRCKNFPLPSILLQTTWHHALHLPDVLQSWRPCPTWAAESGGRWRSVLFFNLPRMKGQLQGDFAINLKDSSPSVSEGLIPK